MGYHSGKKSLELIGEEGGDSREQVQRFIKITELIPEMLEKVDDGSMGFTPAVQLSFLSEKEQRDVRGDGVCRLYPFLIAGNSDKKPE